MVKYVTELNGAVAPLSNQVLVTSMRLEKVLQMVKRAKKAARKKKADVSEKVQKPGRYDQ